MLISKNFSIQGNEIIIPLESWRKGKYNSINIYSICPISKKQLARIRKIIIEEIRKWQMK